eukprot:CAMPEP_0184864396 /NCGR_PEP_ID=MMETSP0580-20130426/14781_1 /TAXON_ID=1118495 /ORGANISM="Dactyliosolen fragilissimus" /LENGTH=1210 /DNA_ID=CAMNT_0027363151 /DNA_START=55 /DNA_END=3687 /DNA_ORIENTATION=+
MDAYDNRSFGKPGTILSIFIAFMWSLTVPAFVLTLPQSSHQNSGAFASSPRLFEKTTKLHSKTNAIADVSSDIDLASSEKKGTMILADDPDFVKPALDKRKYRSILLPNNLQVLLVSDPDTDIESAAVHTRTGHFNDPAHRAGLAHFHEHMLFLGTQKFPVENEFEDFLGRNGGLSNAYTDMEDTNYYLNVAPLDYDEDTDNDGELPDNDNPSKVSSALYGALDRFAQFFISPLFNAESVERELRAIDSEFLNGMTSDSWRNYQLLKSSCNPSHPFSKFGCGNYNTLTNGGDITGKSAEDSGGSSPRDDLIQFWEQNYVAENMKLCVVAKAEINHMQECVEELFKDVRPRDKARLNGSDNVHSNDSSSSELNQKINGESNIDQFFKSENQKYGVEAFGSSELRVVREIIPLVEMRSIKIYFPTPPSNDELVRKTRPFRVISHLLGHESPGSLHSLLLEEGLINGLSSGVGIGASDFSMSTVSLSLTQKGMERRDYVLDLVWQWIAMVREAVYNDPDLMGTFHDEMNQMASNSFRFRENGDPTDFCSNAADMLFDYEPSKLLLGSSKSDPYDSEIANRFMDRFTPGNCMINIFDSDLEKEDRKAETSYLSDNKAPWLTEKWYKAKYREFPISQTVLDNWANTSNVDSRLRLPALNAFIPSDFSLRADDDEALLSFDPDIDYSKVMPTLIMEKLGLRVWHKLDRTFRVPKISFRLFLTSPNVYRSPRTITLNRIYEKILRDDLNSLVYDASIAGCNYRVSCGPEGFSISVSGYSEKLSQLLDVVTSRMLSIIEDMKKGKNGSPALYQKFLKAKDNLLRDTKNGKLDSPYETASYMARMMMEDNVWHINNYIAEMEGEYAESDPLTMEECAKTAEDSLTKRLSAELLSMGNINENDAKDVTKLIQTRFLNTARPLQYEEIPQIKTLRMPTRDEARKIFGPELKDGIPLVLEELAYSDSEENNAVQIILQADAEHSMGYEGVALLELISQMAYNSAYNQLRTKEQLGYIVSAFVKKTSGGGQAFTIVVQSSTTMPDALEDRCEAWLKQFREELVDFPPERFAMEATAVVAQLLERNIGFKDEVSFAWGEILSSSNLGSKHSKPAFDRMEKLAKELVVSDFKNEAFEDSLGGSKISIEKTSQDLKDQVLRIWDQYFALGAPERSGVSVRVYGQNGKDHYKNNVGKPGYLSTYDDVRQVKNFFGAIPPASYWVNTE